jgi:hypothetical protein
MGKDRGATMLVLRCALSTFLPTLLLFACSHAPTRPDSAPSDLFTRVTYDCRQDVVKAEWDSSCVDVAVCLRSTDPPACLVRQAGQHNPASVACAARHLGAKANASYMAAGNPGDEVVADAAQEWIASRQLGFK